MLSGFLNINTMEAMTNAKTGKFNDQHSLIIKELIIIEIYEKIIALIDSKLKDLLNKLSTNVITVEQYKYRSEIYNDLTAEYLVKLDALKAKKTGQSNVK